MTQTPLYRVCKTYYNRTTFPDRLHTTLTQLSFPCSSRKAYYTNTFTQTHTHCINNPRTRHTDTKMYRTPTTSGAARKPGSSSPTATPSAPAQDAAKTFIRRPDRKRRSLDNMAIYNKHIEDYAVKPSDALLQEVMKTFEDIPAKVQEYPQMRKDIKTFLEGQSDKCLRILFELSKRVTCLEATATKTRSPRTARSPEKDDVHILEKLGEVENLVQKRLNELESRMLACFDDQIRLQNDDCADMVRKIGNKIDDAKAAIDHTTEGVRIAHRSQIILDEKLDNIAGNVAAVNATVIEVAKK